MGHLGHPSAQTRANFKVRSDQISKICKVASLGNLLQCSWWRAFLYTHLKFPLLLPVAIASSPFTLYLGKNLALTSLYATTGSWRQQLGLPEPLLPQDKETQLPQHLLTAGLCPTSRPAGPPFSIKLVPACAAVWGYGTRMQDVLVLCRSLLNFWGSC